MESNLKQRTLVSRAGDTSFPTMLLPHQPGSRTFIDNMALKLGLDLEKIVIWQRGFDFKPFSPWTCNKQISLNEGSCESAGRCQWAEETSRAPEPSCRFLRGKVRYKLTVRAATSHYDHHAQVCGCLWSDRGDVCVCVEMCIIGIPSTAAHCRDTVSLAVASLSSLLVLTQC